MGEISAPPPDPSQRTDAPPPAEPPATPPPTTTGGSSVPPPVPPHGHPKLTLAAITAFIVALATLVTALTGAFETGKSTIRSTAQNNLMHRAVEASIAAQSTPTPACNPAPGAGRLGTCAPAQALGAANSLAKAAGDPDHITGLLGPDSSSYQPCGYSVAAFAFAAYKATEGTRYTDRCLRANVAAARAAHKPFMLYDFARPGSSTPEDEARHFIAAVEGVGAGNFVNELPPVLDVEVNDHAMSPGRMHAYICAWHSYVRGYFHLSISTTYTGNWFYPKNVAGGRGDNCGTLLWDSAYATFAITPPAWDRITWWQYSDGTYGPTPHILGGDSNVFQGTQAQLNALAHQPPPFPPQAAVNCASERKLWARRSKQGSLHKYGRGKLRALYDANGRLGWGCHLTGDPFKLPPPDDWAKRDCQAVEAGWRRGDHGPAQQASLRHIERWGFRCHLDAPDGVIRVAVVSA